jgi:ferritin-like metal-binding protein YciE
MRLLSTTTFNDLNDLFLNQLEDLYDAENRLVDALPKMADAAASRELKDAFLGHLAETQEHVRRLEQIFGQIGQEPTRETCEAMKGLVREGAEMIDAKGNPAIKDAALIAAAQRVEHYEMAGYGAVRSFAQRLGHPEIAQILQRTLDEEGEANKHLMQLAEAGSNPAAASSFNA